MKTPYRNYTNDELMETINAFYNLKAHLIQTEENYKLDKLSFVWLLEELKTRTLNEQIFIRK